MAAKQVKQVSGHSVRMGAAQDLLALNIDLASIMQAGRWKSSRMPMRYGEAIFGGTCWNGARCSRPGTRSMIGNAK
jgi:hypothetical protein